jgi:hypothetical protein
MLASVKEEQTEESDAKTVSETGDSGADPNFSFSDDSYSHTSDNKSSSVAEINVSTLRESQNTDLTTEKENRKPESKKGEKSRATRMGKK